MTFIPPSFCLAKPEEADQAVAWVQRVSENLNGEVWDPIFEGEVSAYPTLISSVLDEGFGGDWEVKCLSFVSAACRAGEPVYAEFVHDLCLFSEMKVGDNYGALIRDIFAAAREGKSFDVPLSAYIPQTPAEWLGKFGLDDAASDEFMRGVAEYSVSHAVRKALDFHSQTIGRDLALAAAKKAIEDFEAGIPEE